MRIRLESRSVQFGVWRALCPGMMCSFAFKHRHTSLHRRQPKALIPPQTQLEHLHDRWNENKKRKTSDCAQMFVLLMFSFPCQSSFHLAISLHHFNLKLPDNPVFIDCSDLTVRKGVWWNVLAQTLSHPLTHPQPYVEDWMWLMQSHRAGVCMLHTRADGVIEYWEVRREFIGWAESLIL